MVLTLLLGICFWREGLEGAFGPEQRGAKGGCLRYTPEKVVVGSVHVPDGMFGRRGRR
jgi:hypothetical protein